MQFRKLFATTTDFKPKERNNKINKFKYSKKSPTTNQINKIYCIEYLKNKIKITNTIIMKTCTFHSIHKKNTFKTLEVNDMNYFYCKNYKNTTTKIIYTNRKQQHKLF